MNCCVNKRLSFLAVLTPACLFAGGGIVFAQGSQGLDSHVHGAAELNVVVMGQQMQFEFISPAMNLLGFERSPQSEDETRLLDQVISELQTGEWLFAEALANCQQVALEFTAPEFGGDSHEGHEHDAHEHEHGHENAAGSHADFRAQYLYDCASAPEKAFRLNVFSRFQGIEELTVQWLADGRQGLTQLTANTPSLEMD